MKNRDLVKKLKAAGWRIEHGGNHDLATNDVHPGIKIPIPRHIEVNEMTAKAILKQAGLQ